MRRLRGELFESAPGATPDDEMHRHARLSLLGHSDVLSERRDWRTRRTGDQPRRMRTAQLKLSPTTEVEPYDHLPAKVAAATNVRVATGRRGSGSAPGRRAARS